MPKNRKTLKTRRKDRVRAGTKTHPKAPLTARRKDGTGFPSSGRRTHHALVDDIGNPLFSEQEDYGGAGDLGTTGAVNRDVARSTDLGIHDPRRPRRGPGDTGERRRRAQRRRKA